MQVTPFIVQMVAIEHQIGETINKFSQECDAKQFPMAGCELGKLEAMAAELNRIARLTRDALWMDSQK